MPTLRLRRPALRRLPVVLFGVGYVWWFLTRGVIVNHVLVLVSMALFFALGSVGLPRRRWLHSLGDYVLFAAMWLAYVESRGLADRLGFPIQVESVRDLDRFFFLGADAVVELQRRFLAPPGTVRWYDVVGSTVYFSHFVVVPATIALLWFLNRPHWVRFMRRFATMLLLACATFVFLPTAPPWMAGDPDDGYDALPELRRPTGNGWRHLGMDAAIDAWDTGRDWANPVAAMPSLHAAFALFVVVFSFRWVTDRRWRAALLLYPATMALALMYFAEHYLADALGGWLIVGVTFWLWHRIENRRSARTQRDGKAEQSVEAAAEPSPAAVTDPQTPAAPGLSLETEERTAVDVELGTGREPGLIGAEERDD